jgi:superfamily II DNA or RNA helicase
MSLYDDKPVLALLPRTLMQQWQTELWDLLDVPSARWDGRQWIDEQGLEYPGSTKNPLLECPRRIGLVSQGLVVHGSAQVQALLDIDWSCVLVDEAHRARRSKLPKETEHGPRINNPETEANRLYAFLYKLAPRTRSMLMGTATPVQLHPIEAWDDEPDEEDSESDDDLYPGSTAASPDSEDLSLCNLTPEMRQKLEECGRALEAGLEAGPGSDPKWARIEEYLVDRQWAEAGCILFSQYLDTARWVAQQIKDALPGQPIGLYAGGSNSGIYSDGSFLRKEREDIKLMVKTGELKLLVGTDAASEGLNLQMLGTLINVDLPWNPTRLEQRKGRIQRIGQVRSAVNILNLRYSPSVEEKVHQALSGRLEEIRKMFGQIPDVLSDVWVQVALGNIEQARQRLDEVKPFHAFDERYSRVEESPTHRGLPYGLIPV